jgi:ribosomal protein L37AE/L43A
MEEGRIKKGITYSVCPICFVGKVKQLDDGQMFCKKCKSTWSFNGE